MSFLFVHTETTAMNPQFHIQIPRSNNIKCHVVVSVTQQYETNPEVGGGLGRGVLGGQGEQNFMSQMLYRFYQIWSL